MDVFELADCISGALEIEGATYSEVITAATGDDPCRMIDVVHALRAVGADGDPWVDEICDEMDQRIRLAH